MNQVNFNQMEPPMMHMNKRDEKGTMKNMMNFGEQAMPMCSQYNQFNYQRFSGGMQMQPNGLCLPIQNKML